MPPTHLKPAPEGGSTSTALAGPVFHLDDEAFAFYVELPEGHSIAAFERAYVEAERRGFLIMDADECEPEPLPERGVVRYWMTPDVREVA